jgi:nitroreductase
MDTLETIKNRQSIRKFDSTPIKKDDVDKILKAGFEAPSAMNRRPYEFVVCTKNEFWKEMVPFKSTCAIMAETPLCVLIVGNSNVNPTDEFLIEDCSACAENMLLAAKDLGYGSLWAGVKWHSEFYDALIKHFHLPDGYLPIAVLLFGTEAEKKYQVERFDAKKVHYEVF